MIGIGIYLALLLAGLIAATYGDLHGNWLATTPDAQLAMRCAFAGGYGGIVYCLRGIYLNASVHKNWDPVWLPWYILRPLVSFVLGGVSFLFIRAGLFVLQAAQVPDSSIVGFLALAFIAGLNVDRFLAKLEDVAQATWGIRPSRTSEPSKEPEKK